MNFKAIAHGRDASAGKGCMSYLGIQDVMPIKSIRLDPHPGAQTNL